MNWRAINLPNQLLLLLAGERFVDGKLQRQPTTGVSPRRSTHPTAAKNPQVDEGSGLAHSRRLEALPAATFSLNVSPTLKHRATPLAPHTPQGATYLLPHVDTSGVVYTTITNFDPKRGFCCVNIFVDKSTDGGKTWSVVSTAVNSITSPPFIYPNTTFRDGIENTFTVENQLDSQNHYPLYIAYEDFSAGVDNVLLTASYDGGATWSSPIQVNDNAGAVDEFQPNLTVASDGTVSVNFYDRRLTCPTQGTANARNAGIALDRASQNPDYTGPIPP